MTANGLSVRVWNDAGIARRDEDGYANATAMCHANGKHLGHYFETDRAKAYIAALSESLGISADQLVITTTTGPNEFRGTWIHSRLAVDLARWISPEFAVWMDSWFLEHLKGNHLPANGVTRQDLQQVADMARLACDTTLRLAAIVERSGHNMQGWHDSTPWPVFPSTPAKPSPRRSNAAWPCSQEELSHAATRLMVNATRRGMQVITPRDVLTWRIFGRKQLNSRQAREFLRDAAHRFGMGIVRPGRRFGSEALHLHVAHE